MPPRGQLSSLSWPKTLAMETYTQDSLAVAIIRRSSLTGAGFSSVEDGSLHLSVNCWGLKDKETIMSTTLLI